MTHDETPHDKEETISVRFLEFTTRSTEQALKFVRGLLDQSRSTRLEQAQPEGGLIVSPPADPLVQQVLAFPPAASENAASENAASENAVSANAVSVADNANARREKLKELVRILLETSNSERRTALIRLLVDAGPHGLTRKSLISTLHKSNNNGIGRSLGSVRSHCKNLELDEAVVLKTTALPDKDIRIALTPEFIKAFGSYKERDE
jgi:hypothetical protein